MIVKDNAVHRESLLKFVEDSLTNSVADEIEFIRDYEEEDQSLVVWLVTMEDGEEYWLLETDQDNVIYRKSGIYMNENLVIDAYFTQLEQLQNTPTKDRFDYGYDK